MTIDRKTIEKTIENDEEYYGTIAKNDEKLQKVMKNYEHDAK